MKKQATAFSQIKNKAVDVINRLKLLKNGTFVAKNWALLFPQPMRSVCYGEGGRRWLILEVTMSIIRDEMGCFHLFPRAIVHRALISGRF